MATRNLGTPSILLVSHAVDDREEYTQALRAAGYRVVDAATTVLAYQLAITRPVDVVVTDGHSPGSMSGPELTRRLRIHARTTSVPIIVIATETRRHDGYLSMTAGANVFLQRPVSGDVLREHVERLLVSVGRLPRQVSPTREPRDSVRDARDLRNQRTCAQCRGPMEYRHRSPVLSAFDVNSREPQDRLRYVSGWFCTDPACGHLELARPRITG